MRLPRPLTRALPLLAALGLLVGVAPATADPGPSLFGGDVSWPQCPPEAGGSPAGYGLPLPGPDARFVVIGTTNGYGFSVNPCLADQVAFAQQRGLLTAAYALTTFPTPPQLEQHADDGPFDASTRTGRLRNVGWSQAQYTVARMQEVGLDVVPFLWFDVEPVRGDRPPWSSSTAENAQVVLGALRGYQAAGLNVGFYSNPNLWRAVVGDGLPELRGHFEWRPVGQRGRAAAAATCSDSPRDVADSFQGGPTVMGQWLDSVDGQGIDYDITCPAFSGPVSLDTFFHDWTPPAPEKTRRVRYAPAG